MDRLIRIFTVIITIVTLAVVLVSVGYAAPGTTTRVSVSSDGIPGNQQSREASLSGDGRFVAFTSLASTLVVGDTNNAPDVFVHDRLTGTTERVSVGPGGLQGDGASISPSISADGRYVAFASAATNLVENDTNWFEDIFVRDRLTGTTSRVSVGIGGAPANGFSLWTSISDNGNLVAFASNATNLILNDTNATSDIFVRNMTTGTTVRANVASDGSEANSYASYPSLSADGRFVAFTSPATNLVAGDGNEAGDVFLRDLQAGTTSLISLSSGDAQADRESFYPGVSDGGHYVVFQSSATNLVAGDTNAADDIFVRDRLSGTTTRVSVNSGGAQGNGHSYLPSLTRDGRMIAFASAADNLVAGDLNNREDVFVHDPSTGMTSLESVDGAGNPGNNASTRPSLSDDGKVVAFESLATNLVANDTNAHQDIFVHAHSGGGDPPPATAPAIISLSPNTAPAGSDDVIVTIDGSGFVAGSVVQWNGTALETTPISDTQISAVVPVDFFQIAGEFNVTAVTVANGNGTSNALPFSIAGPFVTRIDSAFVSPGETATVSTTPQTLGQSGLRATLTRANSVTGLSTFTAASYSANPVSTALSGGYGFVDLRLFPGDPILPPNPIKADFYLPPNPIRPGDTNLPPNPIRLMYWSGTAWSAVLSTGGTQTVANLTSNLDGTQSLARFSVIFDATSTPSINALGGTVFAFVEEEQPQTGQDVAVTLTATPNRVRVGQELTYTLTVTNHGPETAKNVLVTGNLLSTVYKVSFVRFTGSFAGVWCLPVPIGSVTCTLGNLPSGASRTFSVVVKPGKTGTIAVNVNVRALSSNDRDQTNNSASTVTTVHR